MNGTGKMDKTICFLGGQETGTRSDNNTWQRFTSFPFFSISTVERRRRRQQQQPEKKLRAADEKQLNVWGWGRQKKTENIKRNFELCSLGRLKKGKRELGSAYEYYSKGVDI